MATRGTHEEMDSPNMPARKPSKQGDFGPHGKRGRHSVDDSDNSLKRPSELRSSIDEAGTTSFKGSADRIIELGSQDPRRSHS